MKKMLFASMILMVLLLASCDSVATPEPTSMPADKPATPAATLNIEIHGTQQSDGGWQLEYIEFSDVNGKVLVKAEASANAVTMYTEQLPDGTFQGSETKPLADHEMFGVTINVDGIDMPGGTIYNYKGVIYWYPLDTVPWFYDLPTAPAPNNG